MTAMIEVKTADLIGPALDWAVAQIERIPTHKFREKTFALFGSLAIPLGDAENGYSPSTCWHCGGPLIEKYATKLEHWPTETTPNKSNARIAIAGSVYWESGPSPLAAVCRAIVRAKLGDVISVPAELVGGGA